MEVENDIGPSIDSSLAGGFGCARFIGKSSYNQATLQKILHVYITNFFRAALSAAAEDVMWVRCPSGIHPLTMFLSFWLKRKL